MDEKTAVIITADHGHVTVGGHGGFDEATMYIPLIVYQKNSGLNQK